MTIHRYTDKSVLLQTGFHVSCPTFCPDFRREGLLCIEILFSHTGLSPAMAVLSRFVLLISSLIKQSRLIRVRSPLLTESHMISFPLLTKMFQFSRCPMYAITDIQQSSQGWLGFPIRKSPDQSLFASSPRLIADFHVLLRPILPRHPHMCSYVTNERLFLWDSKSLIGQQLEWCCLVANSYCMKMRQVISIWLSLIFKVRLMEPKNRLGRSGCTDPKSDLFIRPCTRWYL